jgi:hypothetical protein
LRYEQRGQGSDEDRRGLNRCEEDSIKRGPTTFIDKTNIAWIAAVSQSISTNANGRAGLLYFHALITTTVKGGRKVSVPPNNIPDFLPLVLELPFCRTECEWNEI